MYKNSTVGVVVPAYNEQELIGSVLETIPAFVDRVYVIDDRSTDDTWTEIQRRVETIDRPTDAAMPDGGATSVSRLVPIRHEHNHGVGGAIRTGYRRAHADGIDVTAVMAGDGQMDPSQLGRLIDPIVEGKVDYAKGNRLCRRSHREAMSSWRLFGNGLLTLLTKVASGYWRIGDPQNGYTAISRETLAALDLSALYGGYGFLNDLLIRLHVQRARVADVAMPAVYGEERSTIEYTEFVPALSALLARGFLWRLGRECTRSGGRSIAISYVLGALAVGSVVLGVVRSLLSGDDSSSDAP